MQAFLIYTCVVLNLNFKILVIARGNNLSVNIFIYKSLSLYSLLCKLPFKLANTDCKG